MTYAQQPNYPLVHLVDFVDQQAVSAYLQMLFACVDDWGDHSIGLRGVGEQGTAQEGLFRDQIWIEPAHDPLHEIGYIKFDAPAAGHVTRWAQYHVAAYMMPALLHPSSYGERQLEERHVAAFTCLLVDIDKGDIDAALAHLQHHMGQFPPSMIVRSGGVTQAGQAKRHVYWALSEPTADVAKVAQLRAMLAAKVGGDPSFGRIAQVVRIPGSVHSKGGTSRAVTIEMYERHRAYELDDLAEAIEEMPVMPGVPAPAPSANNPMLPKVPVSAALTSDIHAGGDGEGTRWSQFSRVAGLHISQARAGQWGLEKALELTAAWVEAHMVPPWSLARVQQEFQGLLNADVKNHGPFPVAAAPSQAPQLQYAPQPHPAAPAARPSHLPEIKIYSRDDLLSWSVARRSSAQPRPRQWLVDGLVLAGKRHLVVAEGGAGKTYLMMDLALKLAAGTGQWLGQNINVANVSPNGQPGTVILMTAEDDLDELDIRWREIDPTHELRRQAGDRLLALPLDNLGGAFPFVRHGPGNMPEPTEKWVLLFRAMQQVQEAGGHITAVIVDTLNSTLHGEENSAAIINEYVQAVSPVCGYLGAAFIVTHHIRKTGKEKPIRDAEDMKEAVRGSSALPAAMRLVMGFWHASDFTRRMRAMGLKPERNQMYRMAVLKVNNPEAVQGMKTLLRAPCGLLEDVTLNDTLKDGPGPLHEAWLVFAIQQAALARQALCKTGANGLYERRAQLPPALQELGREELRSLCDKLLAKRKITTARLAEQKGGHAGHLDVPDGPFSRGQGYNDQASWMFDWSEWEYDRELDGIFRA